MSEHTLILVPRDPWFVPTEQARDEALAFLKKASPTYEWELNDVTPVPESHAWYDRESAKCPHCAGLLDIRGEHEPWLSESLAALGAGTKSELTMPCCSQSARYQEITFVPDIGFARCALGLHEPDYWEMEEYWEDPDDGARLNEHAMQRLEKILGGPLAQLFRRQ